MRKTTKLSIRIIKVSHLKITNDKYSISSNARCSQLQIIPEGIIGIDTSKEASITTIKLNRITIQGIMLNLILHIADPIDLIIRNDTLLITPDHIIVIIILITSITVIPKITIHIAIIIATLIIITLSSPHINPGIIPMLILIKPLTITTTKNHKIPIILVTTAIIIKIKIIIFTMKMLVQAIVIEDIITEVTIN